MRRDELRHYGAELSGHQLSPIRFQPVQMAEGLHDHQTTQPSPQTSKAAATRSADGSGPGVGVGGFRTRPGWAPVDVVELVEVNVVGAKPAQAVFAGSAHVQRR